MTEESEVTASADTAKDTIEFETTNPPPETGSEKVVTEPKKEADKPAAPEEPKKPINPRTVERKREKERLLTENATLKERLTQMEKQSPKADESKAEFDPSVKPDITKYTDAIEYADHLSQHNTYTALQKRDEQAELAVRETQIDAFEERADALRAEKPDFDQKLQEIKASRLITQPIEKVIMASPMNADLTYHLAAFPGDLLQLRGLPENMLPKAIKQLEAFIKNPTAANAAPAGQTPPRQTQAKPPIVPVGNKTNITKNVTELTQEELENMPQSEFEAKYMKR